MSVDGSFFIMISNIIVSIGIVTFWICWLPPKWTICIIANKTCWHFMITSWTTVTLCYCLYQMNVLYGTDGNEKHTQSYTIHPLWTVNLLTVVMNLLLVRHFYPLNDSSNTIKNTTELKRLDFNSPNRQTKRKHRKGSLFPLKLFQPLRCTENRSSSFLLVTMMRNPSNTLVSWLFSIAGPPSEAFTLNFHIHSSDTITALISG